MVFENCELNNSSKEKETKDWKSNFPCFLLIHLHLSFPFSLENRVVVYTGRQVSLSNKSIEEFKKKDRNTIRDVYVDVSLIQAENVQCRR